MKSDLDGMSERLRTMRHKRMLTQMQLEEKSGVSHGTISNLERGRSHANIDPIVLICDALDIPVQWVICGGEMPE